MDQHPCADAHAASIDDAVAERRSPRRRRKAVAAAAVLTSVAAVGASIAWADGTETLGAPSLTVAAGTGVAVSGVGLGGHLAGPNQSGSFSVSVPAGAAVKQVLLYWEGHFYEGTSPDNTVTLNGSGVTGTQIGGSTPFFWANGQRVFAAAYRADVTSRNLVSAGATSLTVSGLANSFANNGAGVVVIYDDGGTKASIDLRDGLDVAFALFDPTLDTTVPQTFTFPAAASARTASLGLMAASVEAGRPNALRIVTGGVTTTLLNPFSSAQGADFDAKSIPVTIPAGATSASVQVLSQGDGTSTLPASLSWIVGSLTVPNIPPPSAGAGTPGYWKNHPEAWPVATLTLGGTVYTKAQLLTILGESKSKDISYALAAQLIAAKLNVLVGADASCISATITSADAWVAANGIGTGVTGSSAAWGTGEPLKNRLDAYNNGLLCAPSRG